MFEIQAIYFRKLSSEKKEFFRVISEAVNVNSVNNGRGEGCERGYRTHDYTYQGALQHRE